MVSKIKLNILLNTSILQVSRLRIKINKFWGDLTDKSAGKKSLTGSMRKNDTTHYSVHNDNCVLQNLAHLAPSFSFGALRQPVKFV